MRYSAIIFDCDGTLLNSERVYNLALIDLFAKYGLHHYTLEHADMYWLGKSNNDIVAAVEKENGIKLPDNMAEQFVENVPQFQKEHLKTIPGVSEALPLLQSKFKTCVASNGQRLNVTSSLELVNLKQFFPDDRIVTVESVPRAKPFPDMFLMACERMEVSPEQAIVIEDSISGVKAGRAGGMYVIGFNGVGHTEFQSKEKLMEAGADIVFSDWKDILVHIENDL